jgi:hypothetical protein
MSAIGPKAEMAGVTLEMSKMIPLCHWRKIAAARLVASVCAVIRGGGPYSIDRLLGKEL